VVAAGGNSGFSVATNWDFAQHAYEHVPYYRQIMLERGIDPRWLTRQRSLEMLPILDRSRMKQQFTQLRATNIPPARFVPNGTGGSTGEPLRFFDDRHNAGWGEAKSILVTFPKGLFR
jgi:phenylacetate-CoA ligase